MLGFLFRGLTAAPSSGSRLFAALTAEARKPHWYVEGHVPDTLDGRFAVLATVIAMALVRIETDGDSGNPLAVTLTERFIEVMESEHRELGLGDPGLGRTVRKLVSMLGRRTQLWRSASRGEISWTDATRQSLYRGAPDPSEVDHSAAALSRLWKRFGDSPLHRLQEGDIR